jgi:tripartite-type tricarboxylate transporter receptor subunit TctC
MRPFATVALAATLVFSALAPQSVIAQAYPTKPVRLIVPYPPGGATDIVSRAAAIEMSKTLAQVVTVDNRPGAGGSIGFEMAARSARRQSSSQLGIRSAEEFVAAV